MKDLVFLNDKKGQSPGAIMTDGEKSYVVKLGVPNIHESIKIKKSEDIERLTREMSHSACEEKVFFNLAEKIGDNNYIVPRTSVVLLEPSQYSQGSCSVNAKLSRKLDVTRMELRDEEAPIDKVLNSINNAKIVHFASELIEPYENIGEFYRYHVDNVSGDIRHTQYQSATSVPREPQGLGAFFALSCFTGNRDCIGNTGANAGIDPTTMKIIVVDGGLAQKNPDIAESIPSSSNLRTWIDYNRDLSSQAQKEAAETFAKIISLDRVQIREIVTNNELFASSGIFTSEEVEDRINQFTAQQEKLVEVFYDRMRENNCLTPKIEKIKHNLNLKNAQAQAKKVNISFMDQPPSTTQSTKRGKLTPSRLKIKITDENTPPSEKKRTSNYSDVGNENLVSHFSDSPAGSPIAHASSKKPRSSDINKR